MFANRARDFCALKSEVMLSLTQKRFVLLWLCSAMVVILVRALAVADLGYDLTVQLQAAQNLVAGHGLTVYKLGGEPDLAQPSHLTTLTHFPAGYSVLAATLMRLGLGPAAVIKTAGAIATILGWWGWALLAYAFFKDGLNRSAVWGWIGIVIAVSSPLLLTPPWKGTDIFLWAFLPWVLFWVGQGAIRGAAGWKFDLAAGFGCGLAFFFRYAGAFLLVYTAGLILVQTGFSWSKLFRRGIAVSIGALPLIGVQFYINKFVAEPEQTQVAVSATGGLAPYVKAFVASFWMLPAANFSYAWWMPNKILNMLAQPGATLLGQVGPHGAWWMTIPLIAFVLVAPFVILWAAGWRIQNDVRAGAVGLFWMLPLFLWGCSVVGINNPLVGDYSFVGDFRYYAPLIPLSVLLAYGLGSTSERTEGTARRVTRLASIAYVFAYTGLALIGVFLLVVPMSIGSGKRQKLVGTTHLFRWPGGGIEYDFSPTRHRALELLEQHPQAILITDQPQWFYAEPKVDRARVHRFGDLRSQYVNGPAEIFVVGWDAGGRDEDFYWRLVDGPPRRSDELSGLNNLHLLARFPEEQMKILETDIPPGARVGLKAAASTEAVAAVPSK